MIKIELDPKKVAEFALEIDKMRKNPLKPRCRCRMIPVETGELNNTGVLMPSISPEPEPIKKGAGFGYWHIHYFGGRRYICYIRRQDGR